MASGDMMFLDLAEAILLNSKAPMQPEEIEFRNIFALFATLR
jgi:hypothetical protein